MPAEVLKISREQPEAHLLEYAARFIRRGEVVGVPTDTLYGLAADPFNLAAVERVFRIKGRMESKALPILIDSMERAGVLARELPEVFYRLAKAFWPGALTMIVEASNSLPLKVTGNSGRIALRWPKQPVACKLIEIANTPLTGTSANLSGFAPCTSAHQVAEQLGDRLPLILDAGETERLVPSTIIDVRDEDYRVVREGAISEEEIVRTMA